jgi:hypothetical protein
MVVRDSQELKKDINPGQELLEDIRASKNKLAP